MCILIVGGGSVCNRNILLLLSFCIISNLWLQVQEGERVHVQVCARACVCVIWVREQ